MEGLNHFDGEVWWFLEVWMAYPPVLKDMRFFLLIQCILSLFLSSLKDASSQLSHVHGLLHLKLLELVIDLGVVVLVAQCAGQLVHDVPLAAVLQILIPL